ncbi:hypothetical protein ABZ154_13730 [Streptomyces sp. NPDC006261]|uniref:hypothetical protein n=1 Tax=Streptomyces sp. NPDC006261 TaxID=3156739 RepID=UPI0033B05AB1
MTPAAQCRRRGCPFDVAPTYRTCGKHCHIWLTRMRDVTNKTGLEADGERAELTRLEGELNARSSFAVNVPGVFRTDVSAAVSRPVRRRPRRR